MALPTTVSTIPRSISGSPWATTIFADRLHVPTALNTLRSEGIADLRNMAREAAGVIAERLAIGSAGGAEVEREEELRKVVATHGLFTAPVQASPTVIINDAKEVGGNEALRAFGSTLTLARSARELAKLSAGDASR